MTYDKLFNNNFLYKKVGSYSFCGILSLGLWGTKKGGETKKFVGGFSFQMHLSIFNAIHKLLNLKAK